jgi:putative membrane protein
MFPELLVVLHVTANMVWIGSIAAVGWLIAAASQARQEAQAPSAPEAPDQATEAVLARSLYLRVATPAFLVSFVCGGLRLGLDASTYMHLHWFHAKLTAVLVVIVLHHVIGAKARKVAAGSMQAGRGGGILVGALLASTFLSVACVLLKQSLVP